jgi:dTDP-4-amino-4,6-dideoxygalactose transaminase
MSVHMTAAREYPASQVRFVEDKFPDWDFVRNVLELSAEAGRWANFGPVQNRLAETIARLLQLDGSRAVVTASSATSALHALAGVHTLQAGRPLVWAISAFGFFSTAIGPLAGRVRVIDCDRTGMIDLAQLSKLPADLWDGVLVTDIFGAQPDFSALARLCATAGKRLIIDSAVSFPACRPSNLHASEIVSFHHTKPWGFGEGGCAIVDAALAESLRSLLNFGVGTDPAVAGFAGNGKMSDAAAALILQRVETMARWADGYRQQRQRIAALALSEGLEVLVTPAAHVVVPHVPVLARRAVALSDLPVLPFAVAKYYRPLSMDCPVATDLYSRIVNIPCHPGMAQIDDSVLRRVFGCLADARQNTSLLPR